MKVFGTLMTRSTTVVFNFPLHLLIAATLPCET